MTTGRNRAWDEIVAAVRERDAESALVRGRVAVWRTSTAHTPAVTVTPAASATFDGSRWHRSVVITVADDDRRRQYRFGLSALNGVVERVATAASELAVDAVWLRSRARLVECWSAGAVEGFEQRLTAAASGADAVLIATTGQSAADERGDESRYDVVFD